MAEFPERWCDAAGGERSLKKIRLGFALGRRPFLRKGVFPYFGSICWDIGWVCIGINLLGHWLVRMREFWGPGDPKSGPKELPGASKVLLGAPGGRRGAPQGPQGAMWTPGFKIPSFSSVQRGGVRSPGLRAGGWPGDPGALPTPLIRNLNLKLIRLSDRYVEERKPRVVRTQPTRWVGEFLI